MAHSRLRKRFAPLLACLFLLALGVAWFEYGSLLRQRWRPDEDAYDEIIREAAGRHGISPYLVKAVIKQESNFNPLAVGAAGERGLMQIMDGAVQDWEQGTGRRCLHRGQLFSPRLNIEVGTWYLARALRRWHEYRDREALALAEYNAGPSRARAWAPEDRNADLLPLVAFPGTRDYIVKILTYKAEFESRDQSARNFEP